jgi:hypothetical protein
MYRPPPLRGRSPIEGNKVLLIDSCVATREVRAAVLRDHGIEVHAAEHFSEARFLWQPNVYDLVLLDVRRYSPGEILEYYEQIRDEHPEQRFAFFLGPPNYLSLDWPGKTIADDTARDQWQQTVQRFARAA